MAKWDEKTKAKALAIAEAISIVEASRQTGVPEGTIKRWRHNLSKPNRTERTEPNQTNKKMKAIAKEAIEEVKAEVREVVADQVAQATEQILSMVTLSIREIEKTIGKGPGELEPRAGWLRALVGAMGQGIEKYQLLTGQPTSRQALEGQVTKREEYYIEQKLQSDPESRELLKQLYRRSRAVGGISQD